MRTKVLLLALAVAVLAVPAGALADKGGKGHGPKQDTYELHGTLSVYTAPVGVTPGSITMLVSKANKAGRTFVGQTVTFTVSSTTKVKPGGALITDGDLGMIQVKGASGMTDPLVLGAAAPKLVVDQTLADAGAGD